MAFFIVSLDFALIECGLEQRYRNRVQEESFQGGAPWPGSLPLQDTEGGAGGGGPASMPSCSVTFINDDGERESAGSYCGLQRTIIGRCCYHSKGQGSGTNGNLRGKR